MSSIDVKETEEDDEQALTLFVLYWKSNQLGCVYYIHRFRELYFLMDVKNIDLHDTVTGLLHQIQPTHIMLCKTNESDLTDIIGKYDQDIKIEILNAKYFSFQKGQQELTNWYIQHTPNSATESTLQQQHSSTTINYSSVIPSSPQSSPATMPTGRSVSPAQISPQHQYYAQRERHRYRPPASSFTEQRLSSPTAQPPSTDVYHNTFISDDNITKQVYFKLSCIAPMDSYTTICCVSPLFEAFKSGLLGPEMAYVKPMTIQTISLPDTMHVPADVIQSLEIFQNHLHPSIHQKKGKEIASLYHLLNYTVSPGGNHLLKQWLLRPSLDLNIINERHSSVAYFTHMGQHEHHKGSFVKKLSSYLKHVKNMARILGHIYEHRAKVSEWHQLLQFIYYVIKMVNLLRSLENTDAPIVKKLLDIVDVELLINIGKIINDNVSFEDSQIEGRLTIKQGVDNTLDLLRSKYEVLDDYLLQVAQEISASFPFDIGHLLNVVYFPQLGYLLTLPSTAHDYFSQYTIADGGCTLQFTTQENCYYKNDRTRDMDEQIGDIHGMIVDKQIEIIQALGESILRYQEPILLITQTLAELDCIVSFSMAAIHNGYTRPQMTDDDQHELTINQGRHPLQELVMDTFIANDTFLTGGKGILNPVASCTETTMEYISQPQENTYLPASHITIDSTTTDPTPSAIQEISTPSYHLHQLPSSTTRLTSTLIRPHTESSMLEEGQKVDDSASYSATSYFPQHKHNAEPSSIVLLTGANYSGKSVYLKQIGLIVYMAHIGSFVPAEKAIIGLVDKIFTSIQTTETVSTAHSAFGYDLLQVSHALRYATEKSLVIMDEFGKGTNTMDGAGLFVAVLNEYALRGRYCPKVIATTHFHELMEQGILTDGPDSAISFYTTEIMYSPMETMTDDPSSRSGGGDEKDQVVFLYRIVPGKGLGASFGTWCASLGGIPRNVLERANVIYQQTSRGDPYQLPLTNQDQQHYEALDILLARFMAIQDFGMDGDGVELEYIIDSLSSLL